MFAMWNIQSIKLSLSGLWFRNINIFSHSFGWSFMYNGFIILNILLFDITPLNCLFNSSLIGTNMPSSSIFLILI